MSATVPEPNELNPEELINTLPVEKQLSVWSTIRNIEGANNIDELKRLMIGMLVTYECRLDFLKKNSVWKM